MVCTLRYIERVCVCSKVHRGRFVWHQISSDFVRNDVVEIRYHLLSSESQTNDVRNSYTKLFFFFDTFSMRRYVVYDRCCHGLYFISYNQKLVSLETLLRRSSTWILREKHFQYVKMVDERSSLFNTGSSSAPSYALPRRGYHQPGRNDAHRCQWIICSAVLCVFTTHYF